jgi:hypothetical protein
MPSDAPSDVRAPSLPRGLPVVNPGPAVVRHHSGALSPASWPGARRGGIALKAAVFLAATPALVVVAAVRLALLPLIVVVWRLDQSRPTRVPADRAPSS